MNDIETLLDMLDKHVEEIVEQEQHIAKLQKQLETAEKVCKAANIYVKGGYSPVAIGWDEMIKALGEWQKERFKEVTA